MKKYLFCLSILLLAFACTPEVEPKEPDDVKPEPTEAPKVVSTVPAANATGVELINEIVINYDKPISLAPNPTISVNGEYYDEAIYVVENVLYIPVTLQSGTQYTVKVLKPSVKDADGNYAEDLTLTFTTVSLNNFNAGAFALADSPVDPSATAEAKALYGQLKADFGSKIYTAAMAEVSWNTANAEAIKSVAGKYPAINAFDYIHLAASPADWIDYGDISPVKGWSDKGGIVAAGWHWAVPTSDGSGDPGPVTSEFPDDIVVDFPDATIGVWDNWAIVDSSAFEGLAPGTKMNVYYKDAHVGDYNPMLSLKVNSENWPGLVSADNVDYTYVDIQPGEGKYSVILDEKMLAELSLHGLVMTGRYLTYRAIGLNYPLDYDEKVIYDEGAVGMWGQAVYLDSLHFLTLKENCQVVINYEDAPAGSQMSLLENHDGWVGLANRAGINYNAFSIPAGNSKVTVEVDDLSLASMLEYGLIIGGNTFTLKSVVIKTPVGKTELKKRIIRTTDEPELSFYSKDNQFTPGEALKEGTWQNEVMEADLEKLAAYLKLLQDQNIPVLFRPLHEASGGWFWWGPGTADDYVALWKHVFDYLGAAGIHNLIWVWTSCLGDADWYPGDNYVDIIAYDWYPQSENIYHTSGKDAWDLLLSISNKKMLALGECGAIPQAEACAHDGAMWLWAMPWYGEFMAAPYNDAAFLNFWMNSDWVITLPQR